MLCYAAQLVSCAPQLNPKRLRASKRVGVEVGEGERQSGCLVVWHLGRAISALEQLLLTDIQFCLPYEIRVCLLPKHRQTRTTPELRLRGVVVARRGLLTIYLLNI